MAKNERIKFIDISKAFAIFLIVIGHTIVHSYHIGIIYRLIYSFHIPLFFILSGFTFKIKENETFVHFIRKKFRRILIPYFIWEFLFLIPYLLLGKQVSSIMDGTSSFDFFEQVANIIYGYGVNNLLKQNSALWFLPALFSTEILYYNIIKFNKKSKFITASILFIVGLLSYKFLPIYLPWGLNSSLQIGIFFYIGYLLKDCNIFKKEKKSHICIVNIFLIIGLLIGYINKTTACIDYKYNNYLFFFLSSILLSIVIIYISYRIKENKYFEYIGKNTMGILLFHKIIILIFQTKFGIISKLLINSNFIIELFIGIFVSIISIICSLIITKIVKYICPYMIGETER